MQYLLLFISHDRSNTYMCTFTQVIFQLAIVITFISYGIHKTLMVYTTMLIVWIGVWQLLASNIKNSIFRHMLKNEYPFLLSASECIAIAYIITPGIEQFKLIITTGILITSILYLWIMNIAYVKIFNNSLDLSYINLGKHIQMTIF